MSTIFNPSSIPSVGGGSIALISDTTLSGAGTFSLGAIPGTFTSLMLTYLVRATNAASTTVNLTFNNDTGANYYNSYAECASGISQVTQVGTAFMVVGGATGSSDTANRVGTGSLFVPYYAGTTFHKTCIFSAGRSGSNLAAGQISDNGMGTWASAAAINRIDLVPAAGATFVTGSRVTLYSVT